ncbi:sensory box protein response regulator : Response regulator containing a CheY-like receiver domain and a GGDEF domain OS=Thiocystis violascens (strain ATCC 17096 / DSM 198 / 6111) GN=Thivi_1320 PE=4 SV=1: Response_reg: Response_reg [Gemmata massiliana]|uniref:Response regulatory domain-containing protein n=1 Tax=Gemmata massiliana TaxID=1210884 RepID=A0A6P2D5W1_9BACT|nr:response regulator [Gemmata massiliana]VTR94810.1 sensory box protein response regulator : Response regulator containing a CheY-like receiver domain and a GGDEF domain OS=Thiocystis violascens (strain ATCC 17096 / DSM 198 / 6111) GN=Thivi_1320 PE=4 SV=1: Response_reg: Response_reg [Gemmata massiliana]
MLASILVIEDNPANLELMSYLLSAYGYSPHTATDGAEGLRIAGREAFDLIICDIHLPQTDGYEVARQLKADPVRRTVPLIAVTALAMVGDRDKVLAAGFDGYIAKPIDPETFVRQVEAFLRPDKRKNAPDPPASVCDAPVAVPTRHTVLVVDNLPVNLDLARSILEPHGYRVLVAEGIEDALTAARMHPCDLVLSDVCMSGGTGYDLIKRVKSDPRLAAIPFVFITSTMLNEADRAIGLGLGAARYLFRPIEPEALLSEIESCLREAGRIARGDDSDR